MNQAFILMPVFHIVDTFKINKTHDHFKIQT